MTRIQRETVAEKSAAMLRDRILSGRLSPGTPVTEEAVAEDLGASRATIRQALNTLMLDGLLTRHPTTRVLQVTTLSPEDVHDIYRARRFLELGGVDAAAHASTQDLERITRAVDELENTVRSKDAPGFVHADMRCHTEVVALLGSQHLLAAHRHLMDKLRLVITATGTDLEAGLAEHKTFAHLLVTGAIAEARANLAARLDEAEQEVASQAERDQASAAKTFAS
ncbi:GntR family transcriptional regulator [Streptomyces sp. NPDC091280]|uniref:GntR family transcriptional regulator n=1 Tax=Streptomyces sp. NPDC091280 TaxID=3365984 RepID=UPI00382A5F15